MPKPKSATHGEKMIEVRVRFWTDEIAGVKGKIVPAHAWDHGLVVIDANRSHEIERGISKPFNSLLELQAVIAKCLQEQGVTLHVGRKLSKLMKPRPEKGI